MPIEQLEQLLTDPGMQEALAVVFERSDAGNEELEWTDVDDALSSEQWGRLVKHEVLVATGSGFVLAEPEHVRDRLAATDTDAGTATADVEGTADGRSDDGSLEDGVAELTTDRIEPERWSTMDKAAGAFALALFAGYWSSSLRNVVASVESVVLDPITAVVPFYVTVLLLAVVTGLYSTILQSRLMDRELIEQHSSRMEELRERKRAAEERGDEAALERLRSAQQEAAADQLKLFKVQFRPTVWIMLITIPVFLWLRWKVNGGHLGVDETGLVVPIGGAVSWQEPLFGPMRAWIVWYLLGSLASRQLIRRVYELWSHRDGGT